MNSHRKLIVAILVWCSGIIFLFNQPSDILKKPPISTLETESLLPNTSCRRVKLGLTHPQRSIVASLGNGRLGNQLSNFASCYAIWKKYGMYHHLNSMQLNLIENVFELPKFEEEDNNAPYYLWNAGKCI